MPISHISDTARWVAAYRARESERPDAIFHDPYARRLAGLQGEEIARVFRNTRRIQSAVVVRLAGINSCQSPHYAQESNAQRYESKEGW